MTQNERQENVCKSESWVLFAAFEDVKSSYSFSKQPTYRVCLSLTCFSVSSLVRDLVNGSKQTLFVTVGVQLEFGPSVITELGDGHLSGKGIM